MLNKDASADDNSPKSMLQNIVNSPGAQAYQAGRDINLNEVIEPEWFLSSSEKINEEWRTKLTARGKGRLPYYNWNILLTLNTDVLRREDVPGEVTVGPWMPLEIRGGNIKSNQFFIGFSEFKPGQGFSLYLYSKEPLRIIKIDTLSD